MSFIYLTGASGTGKSSALEILKARGYDAHGIDEDGYGHWMHMDTMELCEFPDTEFDIHEWFKDHRWVAKSEKVAELQQRSQQQDENVYLVGTTRDDIKVWEMFDKTYALILDNKSLAERLKTRTNSEFGKSDEALNRILAWNTMAEQVYRDRGAEILDGALPPEVVVDIVTEKNK